MNSTPGGPRIEGEPEDWDFEVATPTAAVPATAADGGALDSNLPSDGPVDPAEAYDDAKGPRPAAESHPGVAAASGRASVRASMPAEGEADTQSHAEPAAASTGKPQPARPEPAEEQEEQPAATASRSDQPATDAGTSAVPPEFDFTGQADAEDVTAQDAVTSPGEEPESREDALLRSKTTLGSIDTKWGLPHEKPDGFGRGDGEAAVRYAQTVMQPTEDIVDELEAVLELPGQDSDFGPDVANGEDYDAWRTSWHEKQLFERASGHILRNTVALMEQADANEPAAVEALSRILPVVENRLVHYVRSGEQYVRAGRQVTPEVTKFIDHYARLGTRRPDMQPLVRAQEDAALRSFEYQITRQVTRGRKETGSLETYTARTAEHLPPPVVELARTAYVQDTTRVTVRGRLTERQQRIWEVTQVQPLRAAELLSRSIATADDRARAKMLWQMNTPLRATYDNANKNAQIREKAERAQARRERVAAVGKRIQASIPPKPERIFDDDGRELGIRLRYNIKTGEETITFVPISELRTRMRDWLEARQANRKQRGWR